MVKTILAAIVALPQILSLVKEVLKFLRDTFGDTPQKFFRDSGEAFKKLNEAKTPEQKVEAAQEISKLINRL